MTGSTQTVQASRLARTCTLRDGGWQRWQGATVHIAGAGAIGQAVAIEVVRSGASGIVCDFDTFSSPENAHTQFGTPGVNKTTTLVERASAIAPGRLTGFACDVRHLGIGELSRADILIDCTDDPGLTLPLTRISNGLRIPLLRAAIDGSGQSEMGRVATSHGGGGHSCLVCSHRLADLLAKTPRTPCPGVVPQRAPTFAGGPIASMIAGATMIQAQRLVTGNDRALALDQHLIVDMSNAQMFAVRAPRRAECLTGHVGWELTRLSLSASKTTLLEVIQHAEQRLGCTPLSLEPYGHALCSAATCACGRHEAAIGTRWASPPRCDCGRPMEWACETARYRVTPEELQSLGIGNRTLLDLGLPERGAMFIARATGRPPLRLVLA